MTIGWAIILAVVLYLTVQSRPFLKVMLAIAGLWIVAVLAGLAGNQTAGIIALAPLLPFLR